MNTEAANGGRPPKSYFQDEFQEAIKGMSDKQMEQLMPKMIPIENLKVPLILETSGENTFNEDIFKL